MNNLYNLISIISLCICIVAGFKNNLATATFCFLFTIAFLFVANIKNIKKAKASKDGFEFEARDILQKAEVTIHEMQDLSKLVAKTALSLVKRSSRLGGYPEEEQEEIKNNVLKLLEQLKVTAEEQEDILMEWHKFVEIDYVFLLLGNQVPSKWPKEEIQQWNEMRKDIISNRPTPEEIKVLLERNGSLSDLHKEIIEDYEYYCLHKHYRRPEIISIHRDLRNKLSL